MLEDLAVRTSNRGARNTQYISAAAFVGSVALAFHVWEKWCLIPIILCAVVNQIAWFVEYGSYAHVAPTTAPSPEATPSPTPHS
ncbi:MAG: hypothetical protein WCV84_00040 [Patescibacteria group bacterium]